MDTSQPLINEQPGTSDGAHCHPLQDNHHNGHDIEPNSNGMQGNGFIPQTPETMVDEDVMGDESDEAAESVNDNVNDREDQENGCEEGRVDGNWNAGGDPPHQDDCIAGAEGEIENHDEVFEHPQQDQKESEGIVPAAPAMEAAEIVVTSPDGVQSPHYMEQEREPEPEVMVTNSELAEAATAPITQGEEVPSVVMTPAKDQRPSATSTPRSLKEKISASK